MTKRHPKRTKDLFVRHYVDTSPEEFREILAEAGITLGEKAIYRLAGRLNLSKIASRRGPAGGRVGDWEDQIRDASMIFAGLPVPLPRRVREVSPKPWRPITSRVPDPRVSVAARQAAERRRGRVDI